MVGGVSWERLLLRQALDRSGHAAQGTGYRVQGHSGHAAGHDDVGAPLHMALDCHVCIAMYAYAAPLHMVLDWPRFGLHMHTWQVHMHMVLDWTRFGLDASDLSLAVSTWLHRNHGGLLVRRTCVELHLSFNKIGDSGVHALVRGLPSLYALRVLEMQECGIHDEGACALSAGFRAQGGVEGRAGVGPAPVSFCPVSPNMATPCCLPGCASGVTQSEM